MGAGRPTLTEAARAAAEGVGATWRPPRHWPMADGIAGHRFSVLRGLYAGGTLCDEAMVVVAATTGPLPSNIPLAGAPRLSATQVLGLELPPDQHAFIDYGDDDLTQGRAHPMIDPSVRLQALHRTAITAGSAGAGVVVVLDVVLGHGAHPDPAAELASAIATAHQAAAARGVDLATVVSLCGSTGDPQGLGAQAESLAAAGASVYLSNAMAARAAVDLLAGLSPA